MHPSARAEPAKKRLRVAVVWNGRVVDERLVDDAARLGPGAEIPVHTRSLPKPVAFLRRTASGARLFAGPEMRGEIGPKGRELSLEAVIDDPSRARPARGGRSEIALGEEERGFVAVDRVGIFFDFVDAPPQVGRGAVLGADPSLGRLAIVSLVVVLCAIVGLSLVRPPKPALSVEKLPKRYVAAVTKPAPPPVTKAGRKAESQKKAAESRKQEPPAGAAVAAAQERGVARKGLLAALREAKDDRGAVSTLLGTSVSQDRMAAALDDLRPSAASAALPSADPLVPSPATARAMDLGQRGIETGTVGRTTKSSLGPRGKASLDFFRDAKQSKVEGGSLSKEDIDRVVRANKGGIRYCYEKELVRQPDLAGRVELSWTIGTDGKVEKAKALTSTLKSAAVEGCLSRVVLRWKFPAPKGGKVRVVYPFTFGRAG